MASHTSSCIDGHTCGNPVRLVSGGGPHLQGATMLERRAHFLREFDWVRTGLMFEPQKNFRDIADDTAGELVAWSPRLRAALNAKHEFIHPEHPEISGLSQLGFV